jgi:dTDP-4-amino-4,6-dideoxygalactose transaminase
VGNKSIAHFGDMSMFSFHATKSYHSMEGGLLIFQDSGLKKTFDYLKNFGFENEIEVVMPGTNAKMNEMQALMGSILLEHIDKITEKNRQITALYREKLRDVPGIHLVPELRDDVQYNYSFMPIEVDGDKFGMSRDTLYEELKKYNIYARRYFYPLICDYSCYRRVAVKDPLNVARKVASRILTLPIYYDLALEDVKRICDIIIAISLKK